MADEQPDMAWVKFTADFDHRPGTINQTTAYLKGMRCRVTRICAEVAKARGRAIELPAPNRATAELLRNDPFAADVAPEAPETGPGAPSGDSPLPEEPPQPAAASEAASEPASEAPGKAPGDPGALADHEGAPARD